MTIDCPAVLLVQNDVEAGREVGFDAWYLADHMPDRVGTPGFRRARRWKAFEDGPRDLSLYEIDGVEVMTSPPYVARLAAPTKATKDYMSAFVGMQRSVCDVLGSEGFADGGCAALVTSTKPAADAALRKLLTSSRWQPNPETGVVARAVLHCDATASRSDSVESRLRRKADQTISAAVWIEATAPEQARAAAVAAMADMDLAGLAVRAQVLLRLVACFRPPTPR
jgi:hypothetical protein